MKAQERLIERLRLYGKQVGTKLNMELLMWIAIHEEIADTMIAAAEELRIAYDRIEELERDRADHHR